MDELEPSSFGALLRQFRTNSRLTQAELAERAGLSADAVGTLERGVRLGEESKGFHEEWLIRSLHIRGEILGRIDSLDEALEREL